MPKDPELGSYDQDWFNDSFEPSSDLCKDLKEIDFKKTENVFGFF